MAKEINLDAFADKIAEKLLAARRKANAAGQKVGEEFANGVSQGINKHSKDSKSGYAALFEEFNSKTNNFKSRKSISNEEWHRVLDLSQALMNSERYAESVREKLADIAVTFKDVGKISGIDKIVDEFRKGASIEEVYWGEASKYYKKKNPVIEPPKVETPKVADTTPVVQAEEQKQEAINKTTEALRKQEEAMKDVSAVKATDVVSEDVGKNVVSRSLEMKSIAEQIAAKKVRQEELGDKGRAVQKEQRALRRKFHITDIEAPDIDLLEDLYKHGAPAEKVRGRFDTYEDRSGDIAHAFLQMGRFPEKYGGARIGRGSVYPYFGDDRYSGLTTVPLGNGKTAAFANIDGWNDSLYYKFSPSVVRTVDEGKPVVPKSDRERLTFWEKEQSILQDLGMSKDEVLGLPVVQQAIEDYRKQVKQDKNAKWHHDFLRDNVPEYVSESRRLDTEFSDAKQEYWSLDAEIKELEAQMKELEARAQAEAEKQARKNIEEASVQKSSSQTKQEQHDIEQAEAKSQELTQDSVKKAQDIMFEDSHGQLALFEGVSSSAQQATTDINELEQAAKRVENLDGQVSIDDYVADQEKKAQSESAELFEDSHGQLALFDGVSSEIEEAKNDAAELEGTLKRIETLDGQVSMDDYAAAQDEAAKLQEKAAAEQAVVEAKKEELALERQIASEEQAHDTSEDVKLFEDSHGQLALFDGISSEIEGARSEAIELENTIKHIENIDGQVSMDDYVAEQEKYQQSLRETVQEKEKDAAATAEQTHALKEQDGVIDGLQSKLNDVQEQSSHTNNADSSELQPSYDGDPKPLTDQQMAKLIRETQAFYVEKKPAEQQVSSEVKAYQDIAEAITRERAAQAQLNQTKEEGAAGTREQIQALREQENATDSAAQTQEKYNQKMSEIKDKYSGDISKQKRSISNQQAWMTYLDGSLDESRFKTTGKRAATDQLRSRTNYMVNGRRNNYANDPGEYPKEMAEVAWMRAYQEAERQGVADSVLSRYDTDAKHNFDANLKKLQDEYDYRKKAMDDAYAELQRLYLERDKEGFAAFADKLMPDGPQSDDESRVLSEITEQVASRTLSYTDAKASLENAIMTLRNMSSSETKVNLQNLVNDLKNTYGTETFDQVFGADLKMFDSFDKIDDAGAKELYDMLTESNQRYQASLAKTTDAQKEFNQQVSEKHQQKQEETSDIGVERAKQLQEFVEASKFMFSGELTADESAVMTEILNKISLEGMSATDAIEQLSNALKSLREQQDALEINDSGLVSGELKETFDVIQQGESVTGKFVTTAKTVREALQNMRDALPDEQKEWSTYIDSLLTQYDDKSSMDGNVAISGSMGNKSEQYRIENLGDGRLAVTFSGIRDEAQAASIAVQKFEDHVNNLGAEFRNSEHCRDNFDMLVDGIKNGSITAAQAMEKMSDAYEEWSSGLVGGSPQTTQGFLDINVDKSNPLVANAFDGLNIKDWVQSYASPEHREQLEGELYKLAQALVDNDHDAYNEQLSRIADFIVANYKKRQAKEEDVYDDVFKYLEVTYTDVDVAGMGERDFERAKSVLGNKMKKRNANNKHVSAIDDLVRVLAGREDHGLFPGITENGSPYDKFAQVVELFSQWKMRKDGRSTVDVKLADTDAQEIIDSFNSNMLVPMIQNMAEQSRILQEKTEAAQQAKASLEKVLDGVKKVSTHAILKGKTQGDFEDFARQVANDSGMELGPVTVTRDDSDKMRLATIKLINKELAQSVTYTYAIQENADGISEAVLKDSFVFGDASKAIENLESAEKKAAKQQLKDYTWLVSQRSKLDTQQRRYSSSSKGVDGSLSIMSTETSLPDDVEHTIASLTDHIRANIKKAFSGKLTDELRRQIMNDIAILENEIKVRQDEKYSSTAMKSSDVATNKLAYKEYMRAFEAKAKKSGVFDSMKADIESLNKELNEVGDSQGLNKFIDNLKVARNKFQAEVAEMSQSAKTLQKQQSTLNAEENAYSKVFANVRAIGEDNIGADFSQKIEAYKKAMNDFRTAMANLKNDPDDIDGSLHKAFDDAALKAKNARAEIESVFKESKKLQGLGTLIKTGNEDVSHIANLKDTMIEFAHSALDGEVKIQGFNSEGTQMYATLTDSTGAVKNVTVALDQASGQLQAFATGTNKATNEWQSFKKQAVDGVARIASMYLGFNDIIRYGRTGINYVKEIDLAMTELKKVTDETDASYKQFLNHAGSASAVIGSTVKDFTEATATFARLGYSMEESSSMAETAIIYKNVADGLDSVEESSDSIISTMMAFGIEANDTMSIIDRFNAVGNNFAITSAGIGEALQRSASALYSAGNTIDESVALVTAANSVIQNPEQVGTALKTLALRLRGAKTELEEAGLETDNMAESTSTLQAKLNALTHGKVDIMLDADTFKSTTQILREMSEAWEDMTDIERASALELMGGKRQANILSSVIQNFETVEEVIETSMNSSGSAMAENEKWLDSIEGKTYQFTNALQTMWSNIFNSEAIKSFIDFGTDAIQFLDTGTGKIIALVAAVRLLSKFKGISISGIFQGIGQSIQQLNFATQELDKLSVIDTIDGAFKPSNIGAYAAAVSGLTPKLQAQTLAARGLSNEQVRQALALNDVDQANIQAAMSQVKLAQSTEQATIVTGKEAAAILAAQKVKLSDAATSFLQEHATEELTEEMLKNAVAAGTLTQAEATQISVSLGLTGTNHGLAASFKAVGTAISIAFKSNPVGFILSIVTAVLSLLPILDMLGDSIEDVNEKAKQSINTYTESQKTLREQKSAVDELAKSYAELSNGVDPVDNTNINLATDSYQEYLDTCNKIADMYPHLVTGFDAQGNAILSLKGNIDQLIQAYKDAAQASRQEMIASGNDVFTSFKNTYSSDPSTTFGSTGLTQQLKLAEKLQDLISSGTEDEINDFFNNLTSGNIEIDGEKFSNIEFDDLVESAGVNDDFYKNGFIRKENIDVESFRQQSSKLLSFIKSTTTKINTETNKVKTLMDAYLGENLNYAKFDDKTRIAVDKIISGLDAEFINGFDNADALWNWIETYVVNAFADPSIGNSITDSIYNAFDVQAQFKAGDFGLDKYKDQILSFVDTIQNSDLDKKVQDQILQMFEIDPKNKESLGKDIDAMLNYAKSVIDNSNDEIKFDQLNYSDLQAINSDKFNVDGSTIATWEQLQQEIKEARVAMTQDFTTDNFAEYTDSISGISSSMSTYKEALEKLESGTFTITDFMELIAQFPELAEGVDLASGKFKGLASNLGKAMRKSPEALVDELKKLKDNLEMAGKSTDAIDQLISSVQNMPVDAVAGMSAEYVTLTEQINAAKRAHNELNAAMSENPNEGYETRGGAIEQMKDLMSKGMVGSESEIWNIAEAFFGDDPYALQIIANRNADALYKLIDARDEWYSKDEEGNYTYKGTESFVESVESAIKSKEFKTALQKALGKNGDKNFNVADYITWNYEDGKLNFDFNNENFDAIASALSKTGDLAGLTSEEFQDLLTQIGMFFKIDWQNADDLLLYLDQIKKGAKSISDNFESSKGAVKSFLEENNVSLDWLDKSLEDLDGDGVIDITTSKSFKALPDEIEKVLKKYYEIKQKFEEDPLGVNFQLEKDKKQNLKNGLTDESLASIQQLVSTAHDNSAGTTWLSFDDLSIAAEKAGMDVEALMKQIKALEKAGKVIDLQVTEQDPFGLIAMQHNAETTKTYIESLGLMGSELDDMFTIDVPSLVNMLAASGWTTDEISAYMTQLNNNGQGYKFTITTETGEIQEVTVGTEASKAKITELVDQANKLDTTKTLSVNVNGTANNTLKVMEKRLKYLTSKVHKMEIDIKQTGDGVPDVNGTAHVSGTAHANGTAYKSGSWGAPKTETALVGELGPELLVRGNRWTTIGQNGAEFRQIKKGDIIFNHKQTEDLLSKGYVTGRGKAYASGTAYVSGGGSYKKYDFGDTTSSGASALSAAADKISEAGKKFKEVFDWIEVRIEEITEKLDLEGARLGNAVGYSNQNAIVDDMIDINKQLYQNLIAGAKEYDDFAKELLKKVPAKYREKAQNGAIAIETFAGDADEKTLEAIQKYREWVQKGAAVTQQAEETLTEIADLAKEAFDNIVSDFENKISLGDSKKDQLEAYNGLAETTLGAESEEIYRALMQENNKNIAILKEQRNAMQAELNEQVNAGNIKKYSDAWYEAVNAISEVDTEIIGLTTDTYDYQDAINELHWDHFDNLIGRLEAISDESENLIDVLGNKDLVNKDTAEWTDEGIATLGLYAQQMENAEIQTKKYEEEIKYLNQNWKKLGYTEQEYAEKLEELKSGQYDAIKAYNDTKDAIVDLNSERVEAIKEGIQKEIEAYEELISKKKEELDAEKDLHDFQKGVVDQQKEIADIERKLAALSADNSASARAKRAQLEADLLKAQADLEETYYDRSISDQQNALDKELENFQEEKNKEMEGWDEYLENTEQVVSDSLTTIQTNTGAIYQTLKEMGQEYGLSIAEAITSPWKDGEEAIQSYAEKFGMSMSSTIDELRKVAAEYQKVMDDISGYGEKVVNQAENNANTYKGNTNGSGQKNQTIESESTNTIKIGDKINAGSAKIYDYIGDPSGTKQYYASDPVYRVLSVDGNWVQVRHKSLKYGVSGWFKKSDIKAYAKGTTGVSKDQWSIIDELGEELRLIPDGNGRLAYMKKGTGVVPADLTANLMEWGAIDPSTMLERSKPQIGVSPSVVNNNSEIHIDASVGELIHVEHLDGNNPAEITKIVDKAWDRRMKELNGFVRKYSR